MLPSYDALVLDVDGTLLDGQERIPPRTLAAIDRARAAGVVVMLATGRSHDGVRDIARQLRLEVPCSVFNGAAVYCPLLDRLIEQYTLSASFVVDWLDFALSADLLPVVAYPEGQFARAPRAHEVPLLEGFRHLSRVPHAALPRGEALRVTLFSLRHLDSAALYADVLAAANGRPAYYTHFPLAALVGFRSSTAQVVDIQPACQGKAEALRLLQARFGIPAERVVAVGDAGNDLPILTTAGLGVAMGNATPETKQAADRVIGDNDSDALAELIEELFLGPARTTTALLRPT
jgi:Cof subfamily protein (haloacid dehalogenase superfamily)